LFALRWKINGKGQRVQENGKPVLQFVAIKRKDNGQWAIPGVNISTMLNCILSQCQHLKWAFLQSKFLPHKM
jgi:hypothetical protein